MFAPPANRGAIHSHYSTFSSLCQEGEKAARKIWTRDPVTGQPMCGGNWIVMPPARWWINPAGQMVDTFTLLRQECDSGRANRWYGFGTNSCAPQGDRPACWRLQTATGTSAWLEFGGTWPHHRRERMTVAFVDGHTKPYTPSQLTQGCDARPQCGGFITNPEQYLWDLDDYY